MVVATTSSIPSWVIDSGATNHVTGIHSKFTSYTSLPSLGTVKVANGNHSRVLGEGTVDVNHNLSLKSVLHVPQFSHNLLSVSPIAKSHQCSVTFYPSYCVFQDLETGRTIGGGREHGGLYFLEVPFRNLVALESISSAEATLKWDRRLGHAPVRSIKNVFSHLNVNNDVVEINCDTCRFAKSCRNSYPVSNKNKSSAPFSLVHSDVWCAPLVSINGYRYFFSFIDDATRCTWVFLLKSRDEVFYVFETFHKMVATKFNAKIQTLQSDNGGEYMSHKLQ